MYTFNPWQYLNLPLSGDVSHISPKTSLFSPNYHLNIQGDEELEAKIIQEVASYGKQLGKITEAVLDIAGDMDSEAINTLKKLQQDIEQVKTQSLQDSIKQQLNELKEKDLDSYKELIKSIS